MRLWESSLALPPALPMAIFSWNVRGISKTGAGSLDGRGVENSCNPVRFPVCATIEGLMYSNMSCNKAIATITNVGAGVEGAAVGAVAISFESVVNDDIGNATGPVLGISNGGPVGVVVDKEVGAGVRDAVGVEASTNVGNTSIA